MIGNLLQKIFLTNWSQIKITMASQTVKKVSCEPIEPHVRDRVLGDGNCLFRVFSKDISGTEDNHKAFRLAIVNFMTHKDNAHHFCNCCFDHSLLATKLAEPIKSMNGYIEDKNMNKCGWGTDHEIEAFATMLQIEVCVYSDFGRKRAWLKYKPLFLNSVCMDRRDYKIYVFNTEKRDHYDRVIPSF